MIEEAEIRPVPLTKINPAKYNPRTITSENLDRLGRSLQEFGVVDPLVWNEDTGNLVGGHQRLKIILRQKPHPDTVQCAVVHLSPEREKALNIALNNSNLAGEYVGEDLAAILREFRAEGFDEELELTGFTEEEIDELISQFSPEDERELGDPDEIPEVPDDYEPRIKLGDLIELGRHRVMCGDSTNDGDTDTLTAHNKIDYTFTSPPYGIDLEYEKGDSIQVLENLLSSVISQIDRLSTPEAYATMNYADVFRPGESGFTLMSQYYNQPFTNHSWVLRGNRIWLKPFSRLSLAYGTSTTMNLREWEYIQTWRKGRGKEVLREHGITLRGVWKTFGQDPIIKDWLEYDETTDKKLHQAAFPVVLPVVGIRCYSDNGQIVFDPFLGSGTTLIAAEKLDRVCYGMEIEPKYCDIIITRWCQYTGQTGIKINGEEVEWEMPEDGDG